MTHLSQGEPPQLEVLIVPQGQSLLVESLLVEPPLVGSKVVGPHWALRKVQHMRHEQVRKPFR